MTAPMAPQGPSFLSKVFGGPTPMTGDPAIQDRAEQQALINAGVTLASHRGPGALLASLDAGKKAYTEAAQAGQLEVNAQRRQQTQQLLQQTLLESADDPQSLIALARKALAYGDEDGAKTLLEIAKVQGSLKLNLRTQIVGDAKSGYKLINMDTGDIIKDFGPVVPEAFQRDPDQLLKANLDVVNSWQRQVAAQDMDSQPVFVAQLRAVTKLAQSEDSQAQEAFFRALLRIQNPQLARVSDDMVFKQADQQGLINGKLANDLQSLAEGSLPGSVISNWLPTVNSIIKDRIKVFDTARNHYRTLARTSGLDPDIVQDYWVAERIASVPGVGPEAGRVLNRIFNK